MTQSVGKQLFVKYVFENNGIYHPYCIYSKLENYPYIFTFSVFLFLILFFLRDDKNNFSKNSVAPWDRVHNSRAIFLMKPLTLRSLMLFQAIKIRRVQYFHTNFSMDIGQPFVNQCHIQLYFAPGYLIYYTKSYR